MRGAFVAACAAGVLLTVGASAGDGEVRGRLAGRVLATGSGRVFMFDGTGKVLWQTRGGNCHDCWMLPGGNVLFADGEVKEVTPGGEVVFRYRPKEGAGGGAYSCQRLADGRTLVGENSTGRVLEVDARGNVAFELKVEPYRKGDHHNMRMARKLESGNYLVCHSGARMVREYTPKGDVVMEIKTDNIAFSAARLPNGNTMVGHIDRVTEFDPRGKRVWEFTKQDLPDERIGMMCDVHSLPNGNVVVGVYSAYDKEGRGLGVFEVTRAKRLVWAYRNPKADGSMMGVQLLDPRGKPLPGRAMR